MSETAHLAAREYPELQDLQCSRGNCEEPPVMECVWTATGEVWFRFCEDHRPRGFDQSGLVSGPQHGV
jgi:hypothetical protein